MKKITYDEPVNFVDYEIRLEELLREAEKNTSKHQEIWNELKTLGCILSDPRVMKRPYAKQCYVKLITLMLRINEEVKKGGIVENPDQLKAYLM